MFSLLLKVQNELLKGWIGPVLIQLAVVNYCSRFQFAIRCAVGIQICLIMTNCQMSVMFEAGSKTYL